MTDKIAVIILNYFGFSLTISCVNSVLRELPATIFIIDNSADAIEAERLKAEFADNPSVHLSFPETNTGFARGVNIGLEKAVKRGHGKFFLLNNDATLTKGSGPFFIDAMMNHPCTLIAPIIRWDNMSSGFNYYHQYLGLITSNKTIIVKNGWLPYFTGCALIFDRDVLEKIGFLNQAFFMYGEDVELCHRAVAKGIDLYQIPRELIRHEGSNSARIASFFYEYHLNRSHFLLSFFIHQSKYRQMLSLFSKALTLLARAVIRSIRYKTLAPAAAFFLCPLALTIRPKRST